jgi:hypothetical protein
MPVCHPHLLACGLPLEYFLGVYVLPFVLGPLVIIFGIKAASSIAADMRRTRIATLRTAGICVKCGYDLCATPSRCPECGTYPAKHSTGVMLSDAAAKWYDSARAQAEPDRISAEIV